MSQSNNDTPSRESRQNKTTLPQFMSKRKTTKPSLSILTQRDSGNRLITPSSRTSHLHSPIYKIGKPVPTFFSTDNEIESQQNDENMNTNKTTTQIKY